MKFAMKDAGIKASEVDYINAHGTSTHHNDLFETRAIKLAFGDAQNDVLVSSTKSMIGHLLGAAGGIEFITCVKSIEDGYIHENVGLREVEDEEEFSLNYVKEHGVSKDINVCMSNSLGFGGHNATIIVRKYKDAFATVKTELLYMLEQANADELDLEVSYDSEGKRIFHYYQDNDHISTVIW